MRIGRLMPDGVTFGCFGPSMHNVNWRTEYSDIIFWTAISALLLAIKLGAFYIDPTPRILLGYSGVYLSTALDHRSVPYERSFT
jgi:hypothetical protein